MTRIIGTTSKRYLKVPRGIAVAALLALGALATPASADWNNDQRGGYYHNWNGGYYNAPPVGYGSPYNNGYYGAPYYSPPVVYGPGIGISVPFVNIGIH
jgi:hypothetical protein